MSAGEDAQNSAWLSRAKARLSAARLGPRVDEIGHVTGVADGIATISGLPGARLDELLRFESGASGFVRILDKDVLACVLLDGVETVESGDIARRSGEVVRVPVGPQLLGRVIDPLGRPLDGGAAITPASHQPVERPAPSIIERDFVSQPVQTGVLVIDSLFALGRGQRELIIGDRALGKTSIAVDTMINQRHSDMICVYVAIGQKSSSVQRAIEAVRAHGAPDRTIFVVAGAATSPGLQWIAPFAATTMAEFFRDAGQHALLVIDDLSKHAATHRELALLTHEAPGREAYPGDIFYVHARLLERAAKLSAARGGGSLTALPIAETDAGNLSAYIPTNLISITDGQIVLDSTLFAEGQKPAVDVGVSVSRVGGKTQAATLRQVTGSLRLDYAQFLELELFSRFGGMGDANVRRQLDRGARIRLVLAQRQYAPLRLIDEVALLLALQRGLLDPMPVERVARFRELLAGHIDAATPTTVAEIAETGSLTAASAAALEAALQDLVGRTTASESPGPASRR